MSCPACTEALKPNDKAAQDKLAQSSTQYDPMLKKTAKSLLLVWQFVLRDSHAILL